MIKDNCRLLFFVFSQHLAKVSKNYELVLIDDSVLIL